jgi:hypothetical protein
LATTRSRGTSGWSTHQRARPWSTLDEHLDRFLAAPTLAGPFASGWHVRMRPHRVFGDWPKMPGLPKQAIPVADDEPVVVLTLGRPRATRLHTFLPTSARAEAALDGAPGLLAYAEDAGGPTAPRSAPIARSASSTNPPSSASGPTSPPAPGPAATRWRA